MNSLTLINQTTSYTLDSREVAAMVGQPHYDLLKSIRNYCDHLTKGNFPLSDYFTASTYTDSTGRTQPCFQCTKKGCEMIAHKMTGERGTLLTAAYINRFHEKDSK